MKEKLVSSLVIAAVAAPMATPASAGWFKNKQKPQPSASVLDQKISSVNPDTANTFDGTVVRVQEAEIAKRVSYRGINISQDLVAKPELNMGTLEYGWFGAMTGYISENPALFGGNPNRGFTPKIWKAMIRAMTSRVIPMTSDGYLLSPQNLKRKNLAIRFTSDATTAKGSFVRAHLFLMDGARLVGPDMKDISGDGVETEDGVVAYGSQIQNMTAYGSLGLASMLANQGLTLTTSVPDNRLLGEEQQGIIDDEERTLSECFSMAAEENYQDAVDCFKKAGKEILAQAASIGKDMFISGLRGGAVGAVGGSLVPGMGTGTGASYGAITNVLSVVYNAFLRKEKISQRQIENLMDVLALYSYTPDKDGEIKPKFGTQWVVTKDGFARLATENNGRIEFLNILGQPNRGKVYLEANPSSTRSLGGVNPLTQTQAQTQTNAPAAKPAAAPAPTVQSSGSTLKQSAPVARNTLYFQHRGSPR